MARLVAEADLVVHLGGMVSPAADQDPVRTRRVNVGTMRNIVAGVKALPDPSRVTVVGVGSVAQTGPRPQPVHWGRVGDPLRASDMDLYTQSKIAAERILVDSGLPRWTWLRQTGMLSPAVLRQRDPIALHVPLDGVIEWVSDLDSARLLTRIALGECDESLFARVHNVGGGRAWRLTNWEILTRLARAMGARGISQWYERNWFATGSFHGHWFTDSDALEQIVPFRSEDPTTAIARCVAASPWVVRRAGLWPGWLVRALVTGPMARAPRGTLRALHDGDERAVRALRLTAGVGGDRGLVRFRGTRALAPAQLPRPRIRRVRGDASVGRFALPAGGGLPRRRAAERGRGGRAGQAAADLALLPGA